jgi:N-acetylglucosaminyl-diphospho-decaprenol L-rhamnosyltransferase
MKDGAPTSAFEPVDGVPAVTTPSDARPEGDRLALVVVNFASSSLLETNLADPRLRSVIGCVVVVDNRSTIEETRRVRELCLANDWILVELARNDGFGAGVNAGVARAREVACTRVLVLNPDATIDPDSVRMLLAASRADPRALVAPRIVRPDGAVWFSGAVLDPRTGTTRRARGAELEGDATWQTGACFLATIAMWNEVGGFDDDYFMYWEDIDLSWRWRDAGGRLILLGDATAVHDPGGTQSGAGKSPLYVYFNCRNRLLFARKRLASRFGRRWWPGSVAYGWSVATRGSRRMLAKHPLLLWSAFRGTLAGAFGGLTPRRTAR